MTNASCALSRRVSFRQQPRQFHKTWYWLLPLLGVALLLVSAPRLRAQTTAQLTGTIVDPSGGVIPNAQVTLVDEATGTSRVVQTNGEGLYAFPALTPGSYTVKVLAKGFQPKQITGIVLHAGDTRTIPTFSLTIGSESTTVTVNAAAEMIPTENGQRTDVIDQKQIQNLALQGRDTTELLKVLPGATTMSTGLTQNAPSYNDLNVTVQQSAIGNGININGVVNRGGTALLADGANVIDPGNMASSVSIINPDMTQEVSVQASNFSADAPFGPVVVQTISKSGGEHYHGEGYFDARNSVLNAQDWADNHNAATRKQGPQHYYYPGGNFGGPVPLTGHHLFFWGGYERWLQNQGNANVLKSSIPTPEMLNGDFSTDNADNLKLCPNGFFNTPKSGYPQGGWCNDLGDTIYPDGSHATPTAGLTTFGTQGGDVGQSIPSQFLDPGAAALTKIWPKANADPATNAGYDYVQPILNINNGWIYRIRMDYHLGSNTMIYGSYQQAYDSQLAQGNGAHLYWTPGNAIPYPGGGEPENFYGKSLAGHFVHTFGSTMTMDFMAAWAFGSFPFTQPNPQAAARGTLGYTYGKVFPGASASEPIPAYSSAGNQTFPDFSQNSIFDNPPGSYAVKKEAPQFDLVFTKVWGTHTVKFGGFTQTTDNFQSTFATYQDGNLTFRGGQAANILTSQTMGSPRNPDANFVMGILTGYGENNSSPIGDTAYMETAGFVDDTWKTTRRLTLELGARIEHVGHWYDRQRVGMAVFYPDRVQADFNDGKYAPGYYWHAIDGGVPLSGQPNRFAYFDPRFGLSYDVRGNGHTVVRGGWGAYRFVDQVNDVDPPLVTAQHVLGYSLPGGFTAQLKDLQALAYKPCISQCVSAGQAGFDPKDYGQPLTFAYNLTIDQRLPGNSLLDIAYVGSSTSQLTDNGEGIQGSNFAALADMNKTPRGALFKPDPNVYNTAGYGKIAANPENVGKDPVTNANTGIQFADYHPYGFAYGTTSAAMDQHIGYTNYNGLQAAWIKTAGRLTFNLNGTWSKALGTGLQENPYNVDLNYGPTSIDRPLVFNTSYTYASGAVHEFNPALNHLLGNWTISGISTWQHGGYIPAALGNNVPNFSLGQTYTGVPASLTGVTSGLSSRTYFGTDASLPILPALTCSPTSGLKSNQRVNGNCFTLPNIGSQGGQKFPYMSATPYFDNDLAIERTFHIHESQSIRFRASAFNWLNHPLSDYSSTTPLTLSYNVDYNTKAITKNYNTNTFGVMDWKTAAPYQRIIDLNVKYYF